MSTTPLRTALDNATRVETGHAAFMQGLYAELKEIGMQLNSAYQTLGLTGEEFVAVIDDRNFTQTSLNHHIDLWEGRHDELDAMDDDEFNETKLSDSYCWEVMVDKKNNCFIFIHGDFDSDEIEDFLEYFGNYDSQNLPPNLIQFPLNEDGYQTMIKFLAQCLSRYLPANVQIERFRLQQHHGQQLSLWATHDYS